MDERFQLTQDDFPERFHKIVFTAIANLAMNGAENINIMSIDEYISNYPEHYHLFTTNGGQAYINALINTMADGNFALHYKTLKKYSLLNKLVKAGIDVSEYYNNTSADPSVQKIAREKLDSSSLEDIFAFYEGKLSEIKSEFSNIGGRVGGQAAEGMVELKKSLMERPEMGAPMNSKKLTTICRGRRLKKFYLRTAPSGLGKCAPDYTMIPTYDQGWKAIGDMVPGDVLLGRDGKPTKVLAVHHQPHKKRVYEVKFYDGRMHECSDDHLWFYHYDRHNPELYRVETTAQILERYSGRWREGAGGSFKCRVPLCQPVQHPEKEFLIPPYIMGLFLGDGSFRTSERSNTFYYSSEDSILPTHIGEVMKWDVIKPNCNNYSYYFKKDGKNIHVADIVAQYPNLSGAYSEEKYIPSDYLMGSVEQRFELLRGLLDTDGHIDSENKGRISFTTTSLTMKDCMLSLCRSLGLTAIPGLDNRTKYKSGVCFIIHIQCPRALKPSLFKLPRKKAVAEAYAAKSHRDSYKDYNAIVDIIPTDRYVDMTCLTVDNEDALYVSSDYIVTHNTRLSLSDACLGAISKYYDPDLKRWVKTKCAEPTLYITTELEPEEVQTMILAYVACVPEEHILDGKYAPGEEKRVDKAIQIVSEAPLWIEHIPQFNVDDIENLACTYKRKHMISHLYFDYIFSSTKILMEIAQKTRGVNIREDNVLVMFSDRMKSLCNRLNIHIDTSTQASGDWKNCKDPDQSLIRGAKGIADKVDIGYVVLEPTEKDLEATKSIMAQSFYKPPNLVYHIYKVRRGKINHVKLFINFDYATLRTTDLFVTDRNYKRLDVENTSIETILDETEEEKPVNTDPEAFVW